MNNIPSKEDFARAKRLMREESRNLDWVCLSVKKRFETVCSLHNIYILPEGNIHFRAYVIFEEDKHIEEYKRTGIVQDIERVVYEQLELAGRGSRASTIVNFEFDSHENVVANFEADPGSAEASPSRQASPSRFLTPNSRPPA